MEFAGYPLMDLVAYKIRNWVGFVCLGWAALFYAPQALAQAKCSRVLAPERSQIAIEAAVNNLAELRYSLDISRVERSDKSPADQSMESSYAEKYREMFDELQDQYSPAQFKELIFVAVQKIQARKQKAIQDFRKNRFLELEADILAIDSKTGSTLKNSDSTIDPKYLIELALKDLSSLDLERAFSYPELQKLAKDFAGTKVRQDETLKFYVKSIELLGIGLLAHIRKNIAEEPDMKMVYEIALDLQKEGNNRFLVRDEIRNAYLQGFSEALDKVSLLGLEKAQKAKSFTGAQSLAFHFNKLNKESYFGSISQRKLAALASACFEIAQMKFSTEALAMPKERLLNYRASFGEKLDGSRHVDPLMRTYYEAMWRQASEAYAKRFISG